jgi:hypothetical protein
MKKILFIFSILCCNSFICFSQVAQQEQTNFKEIAERTTAMMQEKLELSKDQITALTMINEEFFKERGQRPNFREMSDEERLKFRNRMQERNEEYKLNIAAILTPEQLLKWEKIQEERRQERSRSRN